MTKTINKIQALIEELYRQGNDELRVHNIVEIAKARALDNFMTFQL